MRNRYFGKCALCGKEGKLSFEHIPPRKAFNWFHAKALKEGEAIKLIGSKRLPWDFSNLRYNDLQKGNGANTLCEECNNKTGSWYGNDFVSFAWIIHRVLQETMPKHKESIFVKCRVNPLRILKQVSSMFCSVNRGNNSDIIQSLRQFVLNKSSRSFPSSAKICTYCFIGGIPKNLGIFAIASNSIHGNSITLVSQIDHYPLGFVLYFNPDENTAIPGVDISSFAEYDYDQEDEIRLSLPCYEANTVFPLDYRTQNDIICARIKENFKRKKQEHIK